MCVSDCNDVIMVRKSDAVLDGLKTCMLFSTSDAQICVYALLMSSCTMWSELKVRGCGKVGVHYLNHCSLCSVWLLYCFLLLDNELLCTYCVVSSFTTFGCVYQDRCVKMIKLKM